MTISYPGGPLRGHLRLTGSKSIANRALLIRALTPGGFAIHGMAAADDTVRLQQLLVSGEDVLDCGPAGTTYRFLTGYLCRRRGTQLLTGSQRMKERPIGILVEALRTLGANIEYAEKEGYPPLRIGYSALDRSDRVSIAADTSSQYISSLLMLAPTLPTGLKLTLEGEIVSLPYIKMTLALMEYFGVHHHWEGQTIVVNPQYYQARDFTVEADWSAASYYYSLAALSESADLRIDGLFADSLQGDAVVHKLYEEFGVTTTFTEKGIHLHKPAGTEPPALFEHNFVECPDIAQTLMATCAGLGVQGLYSGLQTLFIKETDRVKAMKTELGKLGVSLYKIPSRMTEKTGINYFAQEGRADFAAGTPRFATYHDHRMAMSLAPLALLHPVALEDPAVVNKSYPDFYRDLTTLGLTARED
ncbi:3-phosphoshikimate 1-carboxyvinyltransferase [Lewinella marina]|uniref:3-phosphoshikimate 1-carboxyvinyltransferase n=1 Tax=Neolewinella marina TaxID=438751 RepID=A0A2G0CDZ6_9BACT|nr:3-phosphoshikimate 1-carboxyvinyltransferase [Neolewinella marina]NJB87502.1 3-phosphoshikimate 1-carboxyvinyltransferase [Neolewinella marina]PHK98192.1 3-phosphoshikimate 1-carboxyvinyltransferase [Neolewinella marina]